MHQAHSALAGGEETADRWPSFLVTPDLDRDQMRDPEAVVCSALMQLSWSLKLSVEASVAFHEMPQPFPVMRVLVPGTRVHDQAPELCTLSKTAFVYMWKAH